MDGLRPAAHRLARISQLARRRFFPMVALVSALGLATAMGALGARLLPEDSGAPQVELVVGAWIGLVGLLAGALVLASRGVLWESAADRPSKVLLDNLLEHFPGLIYFKDRESRFLRISQAHVRHFKLAREEDAWGKTDHDMFSSEHAQQAMRDEQEIIRTGEPLIDFEEKETWASGQETWVSTSKMPLRDRRGAIVGTFGISVDVTRRRQAEQAAGRERDLLHALMNNIPDLIYFKDSERRFTRVNMAHAAALGLSDAEEAVGKTDADFFPADFADAAGEDERRLLETGEPLLGKTEYDQGSGRWFLATKVPTRDANGEVTGLVGISKDVTERRQAEEHLQRDLEAFLGFASAVADGDLTRRAEQGKETLGQIAGAVNRILERLVQILAEVRDAAFLVSSASSEILAASTQIAKGARHGRDRVHQTSAAVEQMVASLGQVAQNAAQSADAARQVLEHLSVSDRAVQDTAQGMSAIDRAVSQTAEKMRLLGERSGEIFEIIDMIEDIASRSELLSMNAAIEAAHAGDLGRGFGVVAEEIRHLAERSTEATRSVTTIVKGMSGEIQAALAAMETSTHEVEQGLALSEKARHGLGEISALVQHSTDLAGEISSATQEQTEVSKTVSEAMQVVASITEQSTAGSNETTRAVQDLVELSEQLTAAISRFRIDSPADTRDGGDGDEAARRALAEVTQELGEVVEQLATTQRALDEQPPTRAPGSDEAAAGPAAPSPPTRPRTDLKVLSANLARIAEKLARGADEPPLGETTSPRPKSPGGPASS